MGTTFDVYLPVTGSDTEPEFKRKEPLPTGTEHILFVDDEKILVELNKEILERHGYQVTTRSSSIEALELVKSRPHDFDLVVTDMTMPKMTGKELAGEINRLRHDLPVILCSGFSTMVTEKESKAMGIHAFVKKPIIRAEMLTAVRNVLNSMNPK
jgi:DNA-binding NtrC family response regulator